LIVNTAAAVISISPACSDPRQSGCRFARRARQCRGDPHHLRQQQSRSADIHLSSMHLSSIRGCTRGVHNLRVQPVKAPKVGDVRHRKRVDPGIIVTPVFTTFPPTGEFSAAAKTSDDATTSFSNAMRVIVRASPDFTSFER
jgi:hypothetical protein